MDHGGASAIASARVVEGRVRKLTDFGAFLEIEEGVDGLVHVSDLSWTKHVKHPSEVVKKGQVMQAVILNIDAPNRRLSLGVKQLQPDAWESFFRSHEVGDMVRGPGVPGGARSECSWNWRRAWRRCATSRRFRRCRTGGSAGDAPLPDGRRIRL